LKGLINTLTAIMTLSLNIRGEMNTQKMSYTNAALRSADATCQNTVRDFYGADKITKILT